MTEILSKFDVVKYGDYHLTNILRKAQPIKNIINNVGVLYDYVIKDGERADTIAFDYYGSSTYTWLIYITNDIFDPYYQWPLTPTEFYDYITTKYGDYYQTQIDIKHYSHPDKDYTVTPYTFSQWTAEQRIGWRAVTVWQYENQLNEDKRNIKLLSNQFLDLINREINQLFVVK